MSRTLMANASTCSTSVPGSTVKFGKISIQCMLQTVQYASRME